jgi:hypothetical protein
MKNKQEILAALRDEFNRWQKALASLSEAEAMARTLPANRSIKDVLVHLWAWQQLSILPGARRLPRAPRGAPHRTARPTPTLAQHRRKVH